MNEKLRSCFTAGLVAGFEKQAKTKKKEEAESNILQRWLAHKALRSANVTYGEKPNISALTSNIASIAVPLPLLSSSAFNAAGAAVGSDPEKYDKAQKIIQSKGYDEVMMDYVKKYLPFSIIGGGTLGALFGAGRAALKNYGMNLAGYPLPANEALNQILTGAAVGGVIGPVASVVGSGVHGLGAKFFSDMAGNEALERAKKRLKKHQIAQTLPLGDIYGSAVG